MKYTKKALLILIMFISALLLSACQSAPSVKNTVKFEQKSFIYKFEDFSFEGISWDSSFSQVVQLLGDPSQISVEEEEVTVRYEPWWVLNKYNLRLTLNFCKATGRLRRIYIAYLPDLRSNVDVPKISQDLFEALKYKYGEPDDKERFSWNNLYESTKININMSRSKYEYTAVYYENDRYMDTDRITFKDLPTEDYPATPVPDTSGI